MKQTPVRPYALASNLEIWFQCKVPRLVHFMLFGFIGGLSLILAFLLNGFLVLYVGLSFELAYAIVIPTQLLLNFGISRKVLFGASRRGLLRQSSLFLVGALLLRGFDWMLYVFIIQSTSFHFIYVQCFNAVILLLVRYLFIKCVIGTSREEDEEELQNQDGIIIGNLTDKTELKNPLARKMVEHFNNSLVSELRSADPNEIHEVGCGEGHIAILVDQYFDVGYRGSDFSTRMIEIAQGRKISNSQFKQASIYDLQPAQDHADTIICCEVMEHLEYPEQGIEALKKLGARQYVFSVPREPIWRLLNLLRFKYAYDYGNTPGHLNHWSTRSFCQLLEDHGFVIESKIQPFPWTMVRGHFSGE